MMLAMDRPASHQFHRHPQLPWAELRVSQHSPHAYRLHMHAEYSLGLVDHGQATFTHADGPHPLQAGSVVLIEPHVWHACNPTAVTQWSYRMLYLQADWLHEVLGMQGLRFAQRTLNDASVAQRLHLLCEALTQATTTAATWTDQLRALLHDTSLVQPLAQPLATHDHTVQSALAQWHQHPETAPHIHAMAQAQGMSTSRFIRHFKAATGVTPGTYRLNIRLNGARRLLAQGAALADAALAMGFADQSHLQRAFKAHHAATPGCYAKPPLTPM